MLPVRRDALQEIQLVLGEPAAAILLHHIGEADH
jgi:hypothetical protein